ncbi:MAG: hypothetical protein M1393_02210 [Candidatus Thermoplasmatota archaeon]|nr:hypothetical protein [Candidatus Thermoplasmatota archaeon]MDA8144309.1 hypothetical protein [Thermoplasmatales archaeon]
MRPINEKYSELALNLATSTFGVSGFYLLLLFVSFSVSRNALITGIADSLSSISLIFSPFLGAWIDSKNYLGEISRYASTLRFLSIIPIALSLFSRNYYFIILSLFSASLIVGLTSDIINSIRSVWVKQNLKGEHLRKGTSLNQTIGTLADVVGYLTIGFVLTIGYYPALIIVACVLAATGFTFTKLEKSEVSNSNQTSSLLSETVDGMKYVWSLVDLRTLFIAYIFFSLILGFLGVIFTVQTSIFGSLASIYLGFILTCLSMGIIIGSTLSWFRQTRISSILTITTIVIGLAFVLLSFIPTLLIECAISLLIGITVGVFMVSAMSYIRENTSLEYTARAIGTITSFSQGSTFIAGSLSGALIVIIGVSHTARYVGFFTLLVAIYLFFGFQKKL